MPGIVFTIMYLWPTIDRKIYKDFGSHNLLDRPRDKPFRTAVGVAGIIYFAVLTIACADDLLANGLHISFERILEILQFSLILGPIAGFLIAYKACKSLQLTDSHPIQKPLGGIIYRTSEGAYHTVGEHHGGGHGDTNGHAESDVQADRPDSDKPEPVVAD
jgi:ubiquinol-cytochrome c reductase cytochrome b subunit